MKLASRVQCIKTSPTLAITAKAQSMKAQGIDVIGFGAGEPDFDTPDFIKNRAIEALREGATKYTPVSGTPKLLQAICNKLSRDNGLDYEPNQILVSCGAKHSLYNIAQALFEGGDEILIAAPYWVSYPDQVLLNDATPVALQPGASLKLTPEKLDEAVTSKTKAVILNSPSNPTGIAYSRKELEELAKIIVQKNLICISDEIYEKIIYDGFEHVSPAVFSGMKERTLVVNGLSKSHSMTGWRMGYAAGPKDIIAAMTKIQSQVTSGINTATQEASITALNAPEDETKKMVKEFRRRRDFIVDRLNNFPGVQCIKPQGAFYVFPSIAGLVGKKSPRGIIKSAEDFSNYLLEDFRVAVVPSEGFGMDGYLRLSYAVSMESIEEGMRRVETAISQLT